MNASTIPGLLHQSVRTAVTTNVDEATGQAAQTLRTTRMEIRRIGESLVVRFGASDFDLQAPRAPRLRRLL